MTSEQTKNFDSENALKAKKYEKVANRLIVFGTIVLLTGAVIFVIPHGYHDKFGAFGEFFGGIVGSVWTLAGVVLFYSALKAQQREFEVQREQLELQRNELKLQRQETELQRKEFERQTVQLVHQNETLAVQKFENTFFHMLNLHNDIVVSNETRDEKEGKQWAKTLYVRFIGNYQRTCSRDPELTKIEAVQKTYQFFKKRPEYLDRYFSNLKYALNFIHKSNIKDKFFYIGVIRAQLTIHEQLFLFYFALSDFSNNEFRIILEEYSFFEELPLDELIDSDHKDYFDMKAFKRPNFSDDQITINDQ